MTDAIEAGYVEKIFAVLEPLIMREEWSGLVGNEPKGESIIRALPKIYVDAMSADESKQRVAELEELIRIMWLYLSDPETEFPGCIRVCEMLREDMRALGIEVDDD